VADMQSLIPEDPRALGQYELLGRLGEGAQGVVYLARDPDGGQVAIKLLRTHLSQNATSRTRFLREATAAKRVPSSCTAKLLDADLADSQPYIVSEYIPGPSLAAVVRSQGPRSGTALERIAINTATALAGIHQAKVVHRDFKAANVLLGPDGPVVIDFGIAKALDAADADGDLTMPGQMAGTPGYMAPEQFEAGQTGPAADIFAWGATMVFAATGSLPYGSGPIYNLIYRILNEPPQLDGLTPPLRDLVAACLNPEPTARPTARDIIDTLLGGESPDEAAEAIGVWTVEAAGAGTAVAVAEATPSNGKWPTWDKAPGTGGTPSPVEILPMSGTPPMDTGAGGTGAGFDTVTDTGFGTQTGTGGLRDDPIRTVQMRQASQEFDFDEHTEATAKPRNGFRMPKGATISATAAVAVVVAGGATAFTIWGNSPDSGKSLANATTQPSTTATAASVTGRPATRAPRQAAKADKKAPRQGSAARGHSGGASAGIGAGGGTVPSPVSNGQPAQGGSAQQAPTPAGGTAPKASAAPTHSASSTPNPYTAAQVCGSGYSVIDSHALAGGTIYLLYNSSTGKNCVATLRTRVSSKISMSATLHVQGGSSSGDSGSYTYYAGPVALTAKSTCVEWGGSIASSSWISGWSHCG
jgi:predicted Ser/Thr protein kinase